MATDDSTDITDNVVHDSSGPQPHIFRFFDLPQELRDDIYDMSLTSHVGRLKCGFLVMATNTTSTNALLVSKAFSHEYQLRARKMSAVTISDTESCRSIRGATVPRAVAHVGTIKVEILCTTKEESQAHMSWLEDVRKRAKYPLALFIRLHYAYLITQDVDEGLFGDWAQLEGLAQLKIYKRDNPDSGWMFDGEEGLHFELSSTTGKLEDVSNKEKITAGGN